MHRERNQFFPLSAKSNASLAHSTSLFTRPIPMPISTRRKTGKERIRVTIRSPKT